jgi:hypothetical protein
MNDLRGRRKINALTKDCRTNFAVQPVASNVFGLRLGLMAGALQTSLFLVEKGGDSFRVRKTTHTGHAWLIECPAGFDEIVLGFL